MLLTTKEAFSKLNGDYIIKSCLGNYYFAYNPKGKIFKLNFSEVHGGSWSVYKGNWSIYQEEINGYWESIESLGWVIEYVPDTIQERMERERNMIKRSDQETMSRLQSIIDKLKNNKEMFS